MKTIIGVWNLKEAGSRLGPLLIFQEELLLQREVLKARTIKVNFQLGETHVSLSYLASTAQLNPFLGSIHFVEDTDNALAMGSEKDSFYWPPPDIYSRSSYSESTLAVQELWHKTGKLVNLESPPCIQKQAREWLNEYVGKHAPVVVHLKCTTTDAQNCVDQKSWLKLFRDCEDKNLPVKFVLIGDDTYDAQFLHCSNVVFTRMHGGSLDLDLALIPMSLFFMGMSSGPCNLAVMSDHPYLIWKHPDHHAGQMEKELQEGRFVFANQYQSFMQDWDTPNNLIREFNKFYALLKP